MYKTQLKTSQLGATGLEITRVGFGAWAIGGGGWEFGWGPQQDEESIAAIHRAVDLGISWVDTAAAYGFGRSARIVGPALEGLCERPYVFTKASLLDDGTGHVRHSLKRDSVLREAEESLRQLGTEAIDLYQVHWPIPEQDIEEGWSAPAELKEQGLVRHIGVSNFDAAQLRRIQSIAPAETLQPPYSLVDRAAEGEILPFAEREGIGVIVYSPMGSGLLTGTMTRERVEQMPAAASMLDAPVCGSITAAEDGTLAIMAGGPEDAFRAVEPLLRRLGRTVTYIGANGQALLLKLAINISLAAQMLAFSEGVLLAERGGIDPALAAGVMTGSAIGSPMLQARAPLMLDLPEQAWFDVHLMHKDIRLVLETGRKLDVPLPSAARPRMLTAGSGGNTP